MQKPKIHEFYLQQCLRLRQKRFEAIKLLQGKEDEIQAKADAAEKIEENFKKKLLEVDLNNIENIAQEAMNMIMSAGQQLDNILEPYRREIQQIDEEADRLYDVISRKYPRLEYEEIKEQIIEYVLEHQNK